MTAAAWVPLAGICRTLREDEAYGYVVRKNASRSQKIDLNLGGPRSKIDGAVFSGALIFRPARPTKAADGCWQLTWIAAETVLAMRGQCGRMVHDVWSFDNPAESKDNKLLVDVGDGPGLVWVWPKFKESSQPVSAFRAAAFSLETRPIPGEPDVLVSLAEIRALLGLPALVPKNSRS